MGKADRTQGQTGQRITRRGLAGGLAAVAVAAPLTRVATLKAQDNPLPRLAAPDLTLVGGWVLDRGDSAATPPEAGA